MYKRHYRLFAQGVSLALVLGAPSVAYSEPFSSNLSGLSQAAGHSVTETVCASTNGGATLSAQSLRTVASGLGLVLAVPANIIGAVSHELTHSVAGYDEAALQAPATPLPVDDEVYTVAPPPNEALRAKP